MAVVGRGSGATPPDQSVSPALELCRSSTELTCEDSLASVSLLSTGGVVRPVCERRGRGRDGAEERQRRRGEALGSWELLTDQAELDNDLDLSDFSRSEDGLTEGGAALPGEVAEDPPVYTPSFRRHTRLELCSRPHLEPRPQEPRPAVQAESEEVQPFCLDASFDYDRVELSHKPPVL
ncbi:intraflagellar transport-associated protein isoform X1 [Anguilla anguilla]|uniref:intraflagellar transport-associated protein isoform X1 n=1 Tax=Anguilla anguilla TaxID=7936 RepID=UPI0015AFD227|nr:intraflagellar transport-associated protein isoform X1 [Anguilla anguilla]XP_035251032.1 intraflagellar transport-associated protein isoform X1 [Anguilla anguilla]